jgi:hypothetical protein
LAYFTMFLPNEGGVGGVDNFNPWKNWRSSSSLKFVDTIVFSMPWENEIPLFLENRNHFFALLLIHTKVCKLSLIIFPRL